MSTLLEHDGGNGAAVQHHYYAPNLVSANSSSLHRPQSTLYEAAIAPGYYAEPSIANLASMNSQMEHLDQQNVATSSHRPVWCQTQLCLLTFTLSLMVALNAGLLFWILSYLNFDQFVIESTQASHLYSKNVVSKSSSISSSSSRIAIHDGLRISGGHLQAHSIDAPNGEQLQIMSPSGVIFGAHDLTVNEQENKIADGRLMWLQMTLKKVIAHSCNLIVKSAADDNLLLLLQNSVDNQKTAVIGVDSIQIKGSTGLLLNSSIQVPTIQSKEKLFLYSPNQRIQIRGPKEIDILVENAHSSNTFIGITSAAQLKLESTSAKVFLNASLIIFSPRLLTVHPSRQGRTYPSIGQLCICAKNGKIFKSTHHHPRSCLTAAQFECT